MKLNTVSLVRERAIARIQINRPERRNALSRAMWREIASLTNAVADDPSVRALTLESAAPGCYIAGADISEFESTYASAEATQAANAEIRAAVDALAGCPQPTVALIDGPCVGGGVALVLACDIRLGSSAARFALTPSKLGLSYHPEDIARLMQVVGRSAASELLFSAETWPADRALGARLIDSIAAEDDFAHSADQLLSSICQRSVSAIHVLKRTMAAVESGSATLLEIAESEFEQLFGSADFVEGRRAFLERRAPCFPSHSTKSGDLSDE